MVLAQKAASICATAFAFALSASPLRTAAIALTVVISGMAAAPPQPMMPLVGRWAARLDIGSQATLLWLNLSETPAHDYIASASLNPAPEGFGQLGTIKVTTSESSWILRAGEAPNQFRLDLRSSGGIVTATYTVGTATGRAQLRRVSGDVVSNGQLAGTYVLPSGENIHIRTGSHGPDKVLSYLEERSGRTGFLYQTTPESYVGGPSYALPDPVEVSATFQAKPARRLVWRSSPKREQIARNSTAYRRQDVRVAVQDAVLGCELLTPAGTGQHPGVVLVPGSGSVDRFANYYVVGAVFAHHGIASLVCDKRGTGLSTGDWRPQSFEQQAQDVVAGMEYLRARSDIEPRRVGIWANSQGTYPAPIAAVSGSASFLILVAGFAIPVPDGIMISNVERMRRRGDPNEEIRRYKDYFGRWRQAVVDNDFAAFERAYREYAGAPWLLPRNPPSEKTWQSDRTRIMWPYQPAPTLRQIKMPVLAFWGSEDVEALASVHKPAFEQALREAGNTDYDLRVVSGADHGLWLDGPLIERRGYAPEYIPTMLAWLRTRVTNARRHPNQ